MTGWHVGWHIGRTEVARSQVAYGRRVSRSGIKTLPISTRPDLIYSSLGVLFTLADTNPDTNPDTNLDER